MKQFKKLNTEMMQRKLSHLQYTPLEILSAFGMKLGVMNE